MGGVEERKGGGEGGEEREGEGNLGKGEGRERKGPPQSPVLLIFRLHKLGIEGHMPTPITHLCFVLLCFVYSFKRRLDNFLLCFLLCFCVSRVMIGCRVRNLESYAPGGRVPNQYVVKKCLCCVVL